LLEALASAVGYGEPNDGMVPISSCVLHTKADQYGSNASGNFYMMDVNHVDGCCLNGDGWEGDDRMPCTFMSNKV